MHLPNRLWTNTNNDIILPAVSAVHEVCASPDSFPIRVSISNSMRKQRCTKEDSWAESCFGSYKSSCLVCLERIAGLVSPPYSTDTVNTPARAVDRAGEAGRAQNTSMPHARPCCSCLCLRQLPAACLLLARCLLLDWGGCGRKGSSAGLARTVHADSQQLGSDERHATPQFPSPAR